MSVYKRCASTDRNIMRIAERVSYIFDPNKTRPELCHTLGVARRTVYDDMVFIKQLYGKTDGRQYLHWVVSYDSGVPETVADQVGQAVLRLLNGQYQAIMATHTNTANFHNHFLINTVNLASGNKFSESISDMLVFRDKINAILEFYGLQPVGHVETISETEEAQSDMIALRKSGDNSPDWLLTANEIFADDEDESTEDEIRPLEKPFTIEVDEEEVGEYDYDEEAEVVEDEEDDEKLSKPFTVWKGKGDLKKPFSIPQEFLRGDSEENEEDNDNETDDDNDNEGDEFNVG